jgi:hypothetical protein
MTGVAEMVAAAARQPGGTLMLRSDWLTPAELADQVLTRGRGMMNFGRQRGRSPIRIPRAPASRLRRARRQPTG